MLIIEQLHNKWQNKFLDWIEGHHAVTKTHMNKQNQGYYNIDKYNKLYSFLLVANYFLCYLKGNTQNNNYKAMLTSTEC